MSPSGTLQLVVRYGIGGSAMSRVLMALRPDGMVDVLPRAAFATQFTLQNFPRNNFLFYAFHFWREYAALNEHRMT